MKIGEFPPESHALIKQYLTPALFEQLSPLRTSSGFTLSAAIRSGLKNPDSSVGIYAGDAESYILFQAILDPIIHAYHATGKTTAHKPCLVPVNLPPVDPDMLFIISTRVRVARNLSNVPFTSHISSRDRKKVESIISSATLDLPEDLQGRYLSFKDIGNSRMKDLISRKLGFNQGDRFQEAAGINRDFPESRGIFYSQNKKVRIWVNEEDHARIISQELSSDISGVFNRLILILDHLSTRVEFAFDKKYGFLTSCPSNIGTAMRAGVHIRLKKLNNNRSLLNKLVKKYQLQIRGTEGEKTNVDRAVFDISNRQRFGLSETQIIQNLHTGIKALIESEKNE